MRRSLEELSRLRLGEKFGIGDSPFFEGALGDVDFRFTVRKVNINSVVDSLAVRSRVEDVAHLLAIAEGSVSHLVVDISSLVGKSH